MAQSKVYQKLCVGQRLQHEIVDAGLPLDPDPGARFYGVLTDSSAEGNHTIVVFYDDITEGEIVIVDGVVAAHIPIPWPPDESPMQVLLHGSPLDTEGKLFMRAESRPLDCTTVFTTCGDIMIGESGGPDIGTGNRLAWDASVEDGWIDDENGAPEGMKQFSVTIQFCDPIWLKEGTFYYMNTMKNSYLDMQVFCPNGYYYMYLGQVYQNTTGHDLAVDHYVYRHPIQDSVPMGDELNTETCSQELPSYLKFKFIVTVPDSDVTSYGYMELEMYRQRSVVI